MPSRALLVALLAATACATPGAPPPRPHSFQDVRAIALVRLVDGPGAVRGKDPLDALRDSLAERGYDARLVEIGRGRSVPREVERLYGAVDARVAAGGSPAGPGSRAVRVSSAEAAAALGALRADAMATYHDLSLRPMLPPPMVADPFDPLAPPGALYRPQPGDVSYRPLGALSLVDRDGDLVWVDWGTPALADPEAPTNAAEAIDALLRILAGEPADDA